VFPAPLYFSLFLSFFYLSFSPPSLPFHPITLPSSKIMQVGDPSNSASSTSFTPTPAAAAAAAAAAVSATHRSYIPSLIPPGVDPAKVDSKMFYTYVPNTIKTRKRTTPAQLEILEGVFVTDKKPNAPRRKELAKKLKMSPREVQVCPYRVLRCPNHPLTRSPPSYYHRFGFRTGVPKRRNPTGRFSLPPSLALPLLFSSPLSHLPRLT